MLTEIFSAILIFLSSLFPWAFQESRVILPCSEPLSYKIGSFDRRFGLSYQDFLSAIASAEAVWEGPSGRELFSYSRDSGSLEVNLVYDYRQETTLELIDIKREVKGDTTEYRTLKREYDSLALEHSSLVSVYEEKVSTFDQSLVAYEGHVARWNDGPRTSEEQFRALEEERRSVEALAIEIRSLEAKLNAKAEELNSLGARLNALATELNLSVEEYNELGERRGETFAGGTYTEERDGTRINIFEFETREKLVRVLAHELGHALGLEHVSDPQAIMYYLNEGQSREATKADLTALKEHCEVQ